MAVTGHSFSERFGRWQVLANNLKESPTASALLTEELAQLDALLAEARAIQDRQAHHRGQAQQTTKQLTEIARRGDRIRSRMQAVLKGKLGFTNEELVRYGLRPLRLPIGRPKTRKEQPAAVQKQQQGGGASPAATEPGGTKA